MLLLCEWTQPIWLAIQIYLVPSSLGLITLAQWLLEIFNRGEKGYDSTILYTLWWIWKSRNDFVFNETVPNPMSAFYQIRSQVQEFWASKANESKTYLDPHCVPNWNNKVWRHPRTPYLKINCDAAFNQINGKGFASIVLRDERGYVLTMSSCKFFANSPLMAEALRIRQSDPRRNLQK